MYILIIENKYIDLDWLKDQMIVCGVNAIIKSASSLSEGNALLRSIKFDTIVMGILLSDNTGNSFKDLIEFTQNTPVRILADLSNKKDVLQAVKLAAQQYLLKDKYKYNTASEVIDLTMSNVN